MILKRLLSRLVQPVLLTGLVLIPFLASCSLFPARSHPRTNATPTPKGIRIIIPSCHIPPCDSLAPGKTPGIRPFISTWSNIHLFLTFDYNISNPAASARNYDFVWGASANNVSAFRSANPNIFLTYYIPFFRDAGTFSDSQPYSLSYWQTTHPDWILYQCDRHTPAYEFGDPNVPLDFTNPAVVQWQVQTYAEPAAAGGYDGIAADNLGFHNHSGACGVYVNGKWVQHYSGQLVDPQWNVDVITWLARMQQALHHLQHPLALIANFGLGNLPWNDVQVQQVVSHTDGILGEEGFTNYGSGYLTDSAWIQKIQFIESVQQQEKPYYIIDQFHSVGHAEIQWALASYLMCKEQAAALYISTAQGYGSATWYSEYTVPIGTPSGSMYEAQNVYWRDYSNGLVIVNPSSTNTYIVTNYAPPGYHFDDLYGNQIGPAITLPPHSGIVLLTSS